MASIVALRALLGASLGLGVLDVVWINIALAPELARPSSPPALVAATPGPDEAVDADGAPTSAMSTGSPVAAAAAAESPTSGPTAATAAAATASSARIGDAEPAAARLAVYFATSSAVLDPTARDTLRDVVAAAQRQPRDAVIVLHGHADHRGTEWLNNRISRDRSLAVARHLIALGIPRARLRIRYLGEARATTGASDAEVWRDRRVDIQITGGSR